MQKTKVVQRLAAYLPFAARQGSRSREWLAFLELAVADARPPQAPLPPTLKRGGADNACNGSGATENNGDFVSSPLAALVHAAAAAVDEQAKVLGNHPNAALYASIAKLIPGAGHFLELEPCLVCHAQEKGGESKGAASGAGAAVLAESQSQSAAGVGGARAGTAATTAAAGTGTGTGSSVTGAGGAQGSVYVNYPLDSIKAASKSTENAMLVGVVRWGFLLFSCCVVGFWLFGGLYGEGGGMEGWFVS